VRWQGGKAGIRPWQRWYDLRRAAYPQAQTIDVTPANGPVHLVPAVLGHLQGSPVRLWRLPTDAPWTKPIEKVWRKRQQELLRRHDFGDDWLGLQAAVAPWREHAAEDAEALRRYTGLGRRRGKPRAKLR
jgi:hypothetical protein